MSAPTLPETPASKPRPSDVVVAAIKRRFPEQLETVLQDMRFYKEGSGGYWGFEMNGTFFGVELDGYIHT